MVYTTYLKELQSNKTNASDTKASFLDLNLPVSNNMICTKIYDKLADFDFEKVNVQFWIALSLVLFSVYFF